MKVNVGYDLDGVLVNFIGGFTDELNHQFGGVDLENGTEMGNYSLYTLGAKSEIDAVSDVTKDEYNWLRNLDPLDERDIHDTRLLQKIDKIDTFYITARSADANPGVWHQSRGWLDDHGLEGKLITHADDKAEIVEENDISFFIDNFGPTIEEINEQSRGWTGYVMDKPYNRDVNEPRVQSVRDFNDIVRRYV